MLVSMFMEEDIFVIMMQGEGEGEVEVKCVDIFTEVSIESIMV